MKKTAFSIFLILLLMTLAYSRRPDLASHQQGILARALLLAPGAQLPPASSKELPPLSFHDLYLVTTTSDPATGTWVSFGFGHYIKVLNDDWGKRALLLVPASPPR